VLALHALPFEAHKALWDTLDVGYFMRHDAADIAWHTRMLSRHVGTAKPIVRARRSPVGEGLQVLVYTPDQADLFARICGYFDQAGFSILDAKHPHGQQRLRAGHLPGGHQHAARALPRADQHGRSRAGHTIEEPGPLPEPSRGRVSRRVKSFPIAPRVDTAARRKAASRPGNSTSV
jgi:[protein-PII] uridylyltransferase